ncbi:MAG: CHASE domain-containing protein [Desulfovibrionaceae bacterium]
MNRPRDNGTGTGQEGERRAVRACCPRLAAVLVLLFGLVVTWAGWRNAARLIDLLAEERFENHATELTIAVVDRLRTYEMALRGALSMFYSVGQVSRTQWREYVDRLDVLGNYPGIQGVGYAAVVRKATRDALVAAVRAEGFPDYAIRPPGYRDTYTPIVYLEPFDERNRRAFGYDMFSEFVRRKAMEHARDTGRPSVSGKVTLVQETDRGVQAGFLMYLPYYDPAAPLRSVEERRAAIRGFVYSPFRVNDFMHGVVGAQGLDVRFSLYDGPEIASRHLMYSSTADAPGAAQAHTPMLAAVRSLLVYGRAWTLTFESLPGWEASLDRTIPHLVLGSGVSIALLLAVLTQVVLNTRSRALALADGMTRELRRSEQRFRNLADMSPVGIFETDPEGGCLFVNRRWREFAGLSAEEALGQGWLSAIHPEDLDAVFTEWTKATDEGRDFALEYRYRSPEGRVTWLTGGATAWRDEAGRILGYFGTVMDIGHRVAAEEALRRGEARLSAVLENAVDAIFTVGEDRRIRSANTAACRTFGYTQEELVGANVNMLMPEPFHSRHDGYVARYLGTGEPRIIGKGSREVLGRRKDGAVFPLELAVSEVRLGSERLFTGILRDISDRVKARESLQAAHAELEARQRRLDRDLEAAGDIQRSLLPREGTCALGFALDFRFMPSASIGGDIFNVVCLGEGHTGLYMVDVSGHGVPAALVSVTVAQELSPSGVLMDAETGAPRPPDEVLRRLDQAFPLERFDKFFSMFYALYEGRTGWLAYCNAGHPAPLLLRRDGRLERLEEGGTLVGLGAAYVQGRVRVAPGDMLLAYTDGVTELENPDGEQFGEDRLAAALREAADRLPGQVLDALTGRLVAHADGRPPDDDISLICVQIQEA